MPALVRFREKNLVDTASTTSFKKFDIYNALNNFLNPLGTFLEHQMGACYTFCCHTDEREEKNAILCRRPASKASVSSGSEVQLECVSGSKQERNPWRFSCSSTSITKGETDQELQAFIIMRNQVVKDTEEWEKLNYDIHTLRYTRREVCARWKKILLLLGYQMEVDSLLTVNMQSIFRDGDNVERARELLHTVCEESSLFPHGVEPNDRYLFVMDRLVSLDSAEDFVRLAKEKYPRTELCLGEHMKETQEVIM